MKKHLITSLLAVSLVLIGAGCGQNTATKNTNTTISNAAVVNTVQPQAAVTADNTLVGTWLSACLVPDLGSAWSEQHQFVIKGDGTAVYMRWSAYDHNCSKADTATRNYVYTLPTTGQINLTDNEVGATIYDMYQLSGTTLKFGHGFQARYPAGYDATQGNTVANRFRVLNEYIVYTKQ